MFQNPDDQISGNSTKQLENFAALLPAYLRLSKHSFNVTQSYAMLHETAYDDWYETMPTLVQIPTICI